ncbi:MAG: protein arginine kinase [Planctomycetes bacterium]|nr:protein arginine kinase [Planctomycetota bacterium]
MTHRPIDCTKFAERVAAWLTEHGPEGDVVVSSRVRLARNLAEYPFVTKLAPERAVELCERVREPLNALRVSGPMHWVPIHEAPPVLRLCLRERHLVSRDLAPSAEERAALPGRAVAYSDDETVSVMVNEEDHLRVQAMRPGFDLGTAFQRAQQADRDLEHALPFAVSETYGYLTCCPTNVGTGLRASVMLHLPALSLVRSELEKVFMAVQRTGLALRGLYGEGTKATGDFYQVSNQVTLGRDENQLAAELVDLVASVVRFERRVRESLMKEQRASLADRVSRSLGMLRSARFMTTDNALAHLSNLRLGVYLGLWPAGTSTLVNRLRIQIQRGHLQALNSRDATVELVEPSERDRLRAALLRRELAERN